MFKVKYIAVELNDDGSINDEGCVQDTPEEAWERVKDSFHACDVVICEVRPMFKVEIPKPKVKLVPIKQ